MSVSIRKIAGVESVNVSLKQGLVSIALKPGNTVTIEQIRKAIKDDAFKPKNARVVAVGELIRAKNGLQFKIAGTSDVFPLESAPNEPSPSQSGKKLVVSGIVSEPQSGAASGLMLIARASEAGASAQK